LAASTPGFPGEIMKKFLLVVSLLCGVVIFFVCLNRPLEENIALLPKKSITTPKPEPVFFTPQKQATQVDSKKSAEATIESRLKDFRELNSKVLLTAEERKNIQKQLEDQNLISESYRILMTPIADVNALIENELTRLMALDYLEKGLEWKENPAREQVLGSLKNIMLVDNLTDIADMSIRKSFAGDKMEAYAAIKKHSPHILQQSENLPSDSRIKKLLKYAEILTNN
jgi:hypothetical protein